MSFVRCPKCRTLYDTSTATRCFACGIRLAPTTLSTTPTWSAPEAAVRKAGKDFGAARILFALAGVLGVLWLVAQVLATHGGDGPVLLIGCVVVIALLTGIVTLSGKAGEITLNALALIGVLVAGGAALVTGIVLVVFLVCAAGGVRF